MTLFSSVRAKATIGATLVFSLTLAAGGLVLFGALRASLIAGIDNALELRGRDIASLIEEGARPDQVAVEDDTDGLVQFLASGSVLASSGNIAAQDPITRHSEAGIRTMRMDQVEQGEDFRVLITSAQSTNGPITIVVGNTLEDIEATLATTRRNLILGLPLLTLLASALTYTVVGRALSPVEQIRAEVAEIGATDLHRRVRTPSSDDEISRLARTMNEMLDRIESGHTRRARFVSDASHELRTPIAVIRHELEVALHHPEKADWPAMAAEVLDEDLRMQRLVDDLLFLARHDEHQGTSRMSLVDLDVIAARQVKRHLERKDVRVDRPAIGAGQVRGNADDLGRVVQNLVNNATRHAVTQVAVSVASSNEATVVLHVDDDGPGVTAEVRDTVFERFTRGDEARGRDTGGAGLGLAIAVEIVRAHSGVLSIGDSPLGGARFTVELPDARAAALECS